MRIVFKLIVATVVSLSFLANAQSPLGSLDFATPAHHTTAKLILSADTAKPGDTIWAGVDMKMQPGWHTYWKNSGAAGLPTKIEWQLPVGITAGEIQWPLPEKFPPIEVTTYGYTNEVVLLVPLTIVTNFSPGKVDLQAKVSWLECQDVCIPGDQNVEVEFNVGGETKNSMDLAMLQSWQAKLPQTNNLFSFQAWWLPPTNSDNRSIVFDGVQVVSDKKIQVQSTDFFPFASDQFEVQAASSKLDSQSGFRFSKNVKKFSGDWPKEVSGVLMVEANNQKQGFQVSLPVLENAPAGMGANISSSSQPLWQMLLYAFIGGLILNIMPCVLPVIALKILGFVSEAGSSPRRVRALGGIYAIGVLFSFLVLAAIVIGVQSAGNYAGWGMQFGSPIFVVSLTTLVLLVALNLFGVFEVTLGGGVLDKAGKLASQNGAAGAFFNGVLATTLATPCTAPFLSAALGFAFSQSAMTIILIFLTVGLGLASPYVLLSCNPAWLKFLPKPGAWMEKFKIAMGFPMLAATIWLFTLAADNLDKAHTLWFGFFLAALASGAWIWGEFVQRGRKRRGLAVVIGIFLAGSVGAYAYFQPADEINWQPWSPEAVAKARAENHPVLVDFTADWCLTCQVNRKIAIETSSVEKKLKDLGVVTLAGDYTHFQDNITAELKRFNHAGVPLVLVYPKNPDAEPVVLPQILTSGIVLDALDRAVN